MYIYIHVYVCMYVCILCVYVCVFVCVCIYVSVNYLNGKRQVCQQYTTSVLIQVYINSVLVRSNPIRTPRLRPHTLVA